MLNFYLHIHIILQILTKYFISHVSFERVKKAEAMEIFGGQEREIT